MWDNLLCYFSHCAYAVHPGQRLATVGSSYFIYGNYYGFRTFLLLAWRVVLRYIKSVRNQLTHYELEEFFRSLQDLLVLSLNPSLSFDFAEFLSRRLDGFGRTLSVLSSRLCVSYWCEVQLLSEEKEQLSTARVGVVWSGVPGRLRLDISEDLLEVFRYGAGFRWAADSSSFPACKAK